MRSTCQNEHLLRTQSWHWAPPICVFLCPHNSLSSRTINQVQMKKEATLGNTDFIISLLCFSGATQTVSPSRELTWVLLLNTASLAFEIQWLYEGPEEVIRGSGHVVFSFEDCTLYGPTCSHTVGERTCSLSFKQAHFLKKTILYLRRETGR